jgi:hypothetical protein
VFLEKHQKSKEGKGEKRVACHEWTSFFLLAISKILLLKNVLKGKVANDHQLQRKQKKTLQNSLQGPSNSQ